MAAGSIKVKMVSTAEIVKNGKKRLTGYYRTTMVNPRAEKKLEKMMYAPVIRSRVLFKQAKIK